VTDSTVTEFDVSAPWQLDPQVSLRDEEFGALAYHHGNRRLVFLKSRELVALVRSLASHDSAASAVAQFAPFEQRARYERALASLARSEVLSER
jgi:putative mycofactocin binding protein MftB